MNIMQSNTIGSFIKTIPAADRPNLLAAAKKAHPIPRSDREARQLEKNLGC